MRLVTDTARIRDLLAHYRSPQSGSGKVAKALRRAANDMPGHPTRAQVEAMLAEVRTATGGRVPPLPRDACTDCGAESTRLVQTGEDPDHGEWTVMLCATCLRDGLALLEGT